MQKTRPLIVRMTQEEITRIEEYSEAILGRNNKSRVVRKLVRDGIGFGPDLIDSEMIEFRTAVRNLTGISRNLNQITKAINSSPDNCNKIDNKKLDELKKYVEDISSELKVYITRTKERSGVIYD